MVNHPQNAFSWMRKKLKLVAMVKKQIAQFDLKQEDFGFVTA